MAVKKSSKPASKTNAPKKSKTVGDGGQYTIIHRSKLVDAPYNPRVIDDVAARRLRDSIKRTGGLIQPPVWNKRTGHIVGGHKRLEQLDVIKGTQDYELTVLTVDWPVEKEIETNIALNSPLLQGEFDIEMLDELLQSPNVEFDHAGIDLTYLESLHLDNGLDLPEWLLSPEDTASDEALAEEGMEESISEAMDEADAAEAYENEQEEIAEIKRRKESFAEQEAFTHQVGVSFRVVCPSDGTCEALLKHLSKAMVRSGSGEYIDGMLLADKLGIKDKLQSILDSERPKKKTKKKS